VELSRALYKAHFSAAIAWSLSALILYIVVLHGIAIRRMRRRVIR
jgi:hypothetical protein